MSPAGPHAPGPAGPVWSRQVGRFLAHVVWSTRVVGVENLPSTGPVVVAANHVSIVDGPLLHGALPRGSHILVKQEMFHGPIGLILRGAGQIPVDRSSGRSALEAGLAVLRRGGVVGIFPEGNRGRGDVAGVRAGVAWLAVNGGAPVVPVAILGTRRTGESLGHVPALRRRFVVELGAPVEPAGGEGMSRREAVAATADAVAARLAEHVQGASERHGLPLPADGPD
ncbi:1-acyl-sn-glycerol-3-phosphate acyltransferase [Actinotalea sp. M2MS4P-6]|uniref:lysophospholipid acyltransferase family protein n=1 Tax=Actinotalea sp. M2MS4P-6 TaxID=2983762 RepID=UPI0021E50D17|nr:lysophospholipid acyltransferase family protein [Actinotalea sp. M2MS4P-6]MCV2394674.1 1-acyl-sn-glycerol-3-phosphate acyltransferase [Actinotalea sp. M2MS4P-6]